jgi:hypothetical protein
VHDEVSAALAPRTAHTRLSALPQELDELRKSRLHVGCGCVGTCVAGSCSCIDNEVQCTVGTMRARPARAPIRCAHCALLAAQRPHLRVPSPAGHAAVSDAVARTTSGAVRALRLARRHQAHRCTLRYEYCASTVLRRRQLTLEKLQRPRFGFQRLGIDVPNRGMRPEDLGYALDILAEAENFRQPRRAATTARALCIAQSAMLTSSGAGAAPRKKRPAAEPAAPAPAAPPMRAAAASPGRTAPVSPGRAAPAAAVSATSPAASRKTKARKRTGSEANAGAPARPSARQPQSPGPGATPTAVAPAVRKPKARRRAEAVTVPVSVP